MVFQLKYTGAYPPSSEGHICKDITGLEKFFCLEPYHNIDNRCDISADLLNLEFKFVSPFSFLAVKHHLVTKNDWRNSGGMLRQKETKRRQTESYIS